MINEILLRRKNKILIENCNIGEQDHLNYITSIERNIKSLGYTLTPTLVNKLRFLNKQTLIDFNSELVPLIQAKVGADHPYNPFYMNFPNEVMSYTDAELYMNAIVAYATDCNILLRENEKERGILSDKLKIRLLELGTEEELIQIFSDLINSKTSLSETDKADLEWFFMNRNILECLPNTIPLKENVALVAKFMILHDDKFDLGYLNTQIKTATDVLRVITSLSDGDISLAENTKYISFKRKTRRYLLSLLNNCDNLDEDMNRYKNRWIRIGEILHPSEYQQYKNINKAFEKIRANIRTQTFNHKIQVLLDNENYLEAAGILKTRPTEFARKLDYLLRSTSPKEQDQILIYFDEIAKDVSLSVLLRIKVHFENRNNGNSTRVFFPKGQVAKAYTIPNTLPEITESKCELAANICEDAILEKLTEKEYMGKVYIDKAMKQFTIPYAQRSASPAMKNISRGSRIKISEDVNFIRSFIWWTNNANGDRVDLDLSAEVLNDDFSYKTQISYRNPKDTVINSCTSGDITDGKDVNDNGVAEFIDMDINSITEIGGRYVIFQVYAYTNQSFISLQHSSFGWMERNDVASGEIFEPATVEQKSEITANSTVYIPCMLDCLTKEIIWLDLCMGINEISYYPNNLDTHLYGVSAVCYGVVNDKRPSMYDLIYLNAISHGELTKNREEADWIFDIDTTKPKEINYVTIKNNLNETIDSYEKEVEKQNVRITTPYDLEVYTSELM